MMFSTSCNENFNTAHINLYNVKLVDMCVTSSSAYYLSETGTLYSPGADPNASHYVLYQNPEKGIVANNVKKFGEMVSGGFYIDNNNSLYIWNQYEQPLFNYKKEKTHYKILDNVIFADFDLYYMVYLDENNILYLVGEFNNEIYDINHPKLLGKNVTYVTANDGKIIWADDSGEFHCYGEVDAELLKHLNSQFSGKSVKKIELVDDSVVMICDNKLWYYGDYSNLITGNDSHSRSLFILKENITDFSCSWRTIAALDQQGNVLIWGRCISNNSKNTTTPQFEYYTAKNLTQNAKKVFATDSGIGYIDTNGNSQIYYYGNYHSFYGNSTQDFCVGINRAPYTWNKS